MGMWLVPSLDAGGGMRVKAREVAVSCGAFVIPAISQVPFTTQHGRVLQNSTGWFKRRVSQRQWCLGEKMSLSGLPEKEMAANSSATGTAVVAAVLLAESRDSGRTGEL